jgi:hypothetical protein
LDSRRRWSARCKWVQAGLVWGASQFRLLVAVEEASSFSVCVNTDSFNPAAKSGFGRGPTARHMHFVQRVFRSSLTCSRFAEPTTYKSSAEGTINGVMSLNTIDSFLCKYRENVVSTKLSWNREALGTVCSPLSNESQSYCTIVRYGGHASAQV